MEKVTIIIPAYNVENVISECLDSICKQTYPDMEVVIVNDGSQDATEKICRKYQRRKNIKLIHGEHRGVSAARNRGIQEATGKYLFFMDADDIMADSGLDALMKYCRQGDWIIGNYQTLNILKKSEPEIHIQYFDGEAHQGGKKELPQLCVSRNFNCVWGKLYSAQIIREHALLFDEGRNYGEDLLFNLEYFQYVRKFVILKEWVYRYCYRFGEGLGTRFIENEWEIQKDICKRMQKMSEDVYCLSDDGLALMNHFYYAQAIAAMQRIADEGTLLPKEKRAKMKEITASEFFLEILEKEYDLKHIGKLDKLLLKSSLGWIYHIVHRKYTEIKKYI